METAQNVLTFYDLTLELVIHERNLKLVNSCLYQTGLFTKQHCFFSDVLVFQFLIIWNISWLNTVHITYI